MAGKQPQQSKNVEKQPTVEQKVAGLKQTFTNLRIQKLHHKEAIEREQEALAKVDEQLTGVANQISAYEDALRLQQAKNGADEGDEE